MNLKGTLKSLLPPIAQDMIKSSKTRASLRRYRSNRIPWSDGYAAFKNHYIRQTLADESLMSLFRHGSSLPPGYGVGIDERCVEYPWLVANMDGRSGYFLDAGSTLNHDYILEHPVFREKKLWIMTLAPETNCFWRKGISYVFCDLREIPIVDNYFDAVACLSTLEHIGWDNVLYTHDESYRERQPKDFVQAVKEIRRVLKPGGVLYISVPYGAYTDLGTFQQFDRNLLSRAIEAFGPFSEKKEIFYRYREDGWNIAGAEECAGCTYVEWINKPRNKWPKPLPVEPDRAAAARAVACVRLVKKET
ncbi:MAG: class I SAM-dependent methyltransferase [Bacillota bacterium]